MTSLGVVTSQGVVIHQDGATSPDADVYEVRNRDAVIVRVDSVLGEETVPFVVTDAATVPLTAADIPAAAYLQCD